MAFVHKPAGLAGKVEAGHGASVEDPIAGTTATPAGPIDWMRLTDGTVRAHGNNQEFMSTFTSGPDQSSQRRSVFSRNGQAPYLTVVCSTDVPNRAVTLSVTAGASHLALVIAGLDAAGRRGAATLTGILGGPGGSPSAAGVGAAEAPHPGGPQSIHWAGPVDLASPWPIHGWPPNAFAHELQMTKFFDPLVRGETGPVITSAPGGKVPFTDSLGATLAKAAGAAVLGALGGGATGGPAGALLGALVGWDGVMINYDIDLYQDWQKSQVDPAPPPPFDPPVEPEEPGTKGNNTQPDDPPPPPPGNGDDNDHGDDNDLGEEGHGDGGGWKIDDDRPGEHPE